MEHLPEALKQTSAALDLMAAAIGGMPLDGATIAIFLVAAGLLFSLYWTVVFLFRAHRDRLFERVDLAEPGQVLLGLTQSHEGHPVEPDRPVLSVVESAAAHAASVLAPHAAPEMQTLSSLKSGVQAPDARRREPLGSALEVLAEPGRAMSVAGAETKALTMPPAIAAKRAVLTILPFDAGADDAVETAVARGLSRKLELVLGQLCPKLALAPKPANTDDTRTAGLPRFELSAGVRHIGDRIRLESRMIECGTGQELFRFRYQGLAREMEVILAELTSRVLRCILPVVARPPSSQMLHEATSEAMVRPPSATSGERLVAAR